MGSNPTLSAILAGARWLGFLLALWLLWDAIAFARIPILIFGPL